MATSTHRIFVAVSGPTGGDEALSAIARAVIDRWPAGRSVPTIETLSLEDLCRTLQKASASASKGMHAVLAVLDASEPRTAVYQFADLLQTAMTPAVVLLPGVDDRMSKLQRGGVLIDTHAADPAFVASALYALAERQPAVEDLSRELYVSQSYQGGVRGEIDRIHEELNLASMVQREFLPKQLPDIDGLSFGVLFRPASYVSGDIYDVARLSEHHVGFFIADAVGHGVPAALLTMIISRCLRMTEMTEHGVRLVSPAEAMTRLNHELIKSQRDNPRFVTAIYGIIDAQTRHVTLAGAGHPPPLRLRDGGARVERVETDGALLGVFAEESYNQTNFVLDEDEVLLLYSDGFETAFPSSGNPENMRRPTERYLEHLARVARGGAGDGGLTRAIGSLAEDLDVQAGSLHQIDDVTALAIAPVALAARTSDPADHTHAMTAHEPLRRAA